MWAALRGVFAKLTRDRLQGDAGPTNAPESGQTKSPGRLTLDSENPGVHRGNLIPCRKCHRPISKRANRCPSCKAFFPNQGKLVPCRDCGAIKPQLAATCKECGAPRQTTFGDAVAGAIGLSILLVIFGFPLLVFVAKWAVVLKFLDWLFGN